MEYPFVFITFDFLWNLLDILSKRFISISSIFLLYLNAIATIARVPPISAIQIGIPYPVRGIELIPLNAPSMINIFIGLVKSIITKNSQYFMSVIPAAIQSRSSGKKEIRTS